MPFRSSRNGVAVFLLLSAQKQSSPVVGARPAICRGLLASSGTNSSAIDPVGKGTGLGLSTVHGIVSQAGGRIEVTTESGRGTTFDIYLPEATDAQDRSTQYEASEVSCSGNETLLLVEDNEALREVTLTYLEGLGYQLLAAADFDHAIQVSSAYAGKIDLLITDIVMPGKNGSQLSVQIEQARPGICVLFMSGFIADDDLRHRLEKQTGFLQKPFSPAELSVLVRRVLDAET